MASADDKVEALLARIIERLREDGGALERPVLAMRLGTDVRDGTFQRALRLGWQREQLAKSERCRRQADCLLVGRGLPMSRCVKGLTHRVTHPVKVRSHVHVRHPKGVAHWRTMASGAWRNGGAT